MSVRGISTAVLVTGLLGVSDAHAASQFTIRGAGYGHGVGMSQYGAYGFAKHGRSYDEILAHYYTDTALGEAPRKTVRVLLQPSQSTSQFTGARSVNSKKLNPRATYTVRHGSGSNTAAVFDRKGRRIAQGTMLRARGKRGSIVLGGVGTYRGALEYRASGTLGIQAVNALDLENYVRGVIALESPASWPAEALKAQAVAARTYALTTSKGGNGFDQYPDTRSQVYGGVSAETPTTDAATRATSGEVVTYKGDPVTTYFFSTSGGRTEDVENTSLGNEPLPWLKSVRDPYDDESPKHEWTIRMSMATAGAKLGGLVRGTFRGIDVVSRGRSPRIVEADVVGTGGRTRTDGATLRARLGLYDTWAFFTTTRTRTVRVKSSRSPRHGTTPEARMAALADQRIEGRVLFGRRNADVLVQRFDRGKWRRAGVTSTTKGGRYAFLAEEPGRYRVVFRGAVGPVVRVKP